MNVSKKAKGKKTEVRMTHSEQTADAPVADTGVATSIEPPKPRKKHELGPIMLERMVTSEILSLFQPCGNIYFSSVDAADKYVDDNGLVGQFRIIQVKRTFTTEEEVVKKLVRKVTPTLSSNDDGITHGESHELVEITAMEDINGRNDDTAQHDSNGDA